jgi:hypothetical protein
MKHAILFIGLLYVSNSFAQITCIYNVVSTTETPKMGISPQLKVEMSVDIKDKRYLIETRFTNTETNLTYSGEVKYTYIDFLGKKVYSFNDKLTIVESYNLAVDTLINTGKKAKYGKYSCDIYKVRNKEGVKLYCCKKLASNVHPGLNYFCDKPIGGIARIEIARKGSILVYQLVQIKKNSIAMDLYIDKVKQYSKEPTGMRSILGN